jgi:cold shock CspA family protein
MPDIIETDVEGVIKFYRSEDGWGFIERDGGPDVFVFKRNLQCTDPYEGESVKFDIARSTSSQHEHEAVNVVRSESELFAGDVLHWKVEPGSWKTEGLVALEDGGDPIPFSGRDMKAGLHGERQKPRPWHAANFSIARTNNGRRAVDLDLDKRYPLQRFAYLGTEEDMIKQLKQMSLQENWDYRHSTSHKESPILYSYLHFTFARLCDEDRMSRPDEKKIRLRPDLSPPLAAFNTGLVDQKYKSVYALFEANTRGQIQPWKFRAFCIPGELHGKLLASHFNPLPKPAAYFHSTTELLYDPDAPLHPDYTHILTHNRDRLPDELLMQVQDMDEQAAIRFLTMYLDEAIDVAKKRARWNYKTAIPHYFPSFKRLEFLLPLCLMKDDRVDVALSVQKMDTGYLANTILKLDWAYKSARLVCRPDSDWLAPDTIQEEQDADLGDAE